VAASGAGVDFPQPLNATIVVTLRAKPNDFTRNCGYWRTLKPHFFFI
jgi:hypothetical protein